MNKPDDLDLSTKEGMTKFRQFLEDNAKHVATWPQWKKEGWFHLDANPAEERFQQIFGGEDDE